MDPIYEMKLHDEITLSLVGGDWLIVRVTFGWIYNRMMGANVISSVFVPYIKGVDRRAQP